MSSVEIANATLKKFLLAPNPEGKRRANWDSDARGFGACQTKNGVCTLSAHHRLANGVQRKQVLGRVAKTGGIQGEDMRDLMVSAIEHRFGRVNRLPATIEWLTDNGSCHLAGDPEGIARSVEAPDLPATNRRRLRPIRLEKTAAPVVSGWTPPDQGRKSAPRSSAQYSPRR